MKNKLLKKMTALSALLICLNIAPAGYAVEPLELHMEAVAAAESGLIIYCNTNAEEIPQKEDFTVILGNIALTVTDVAAFGGTDFGASYIFLVDVSGSIQQAQLQAIKDTITAICDGLTDNDNISIVAIGNETYTQPFASGREEMQKQIDGIQPMYENTNLYESVFTSLAILNTHEDSRDKKILVVFSDGEEYITQGITIDEAAIKIRESRIPIYTVATLGRNPAPHYVETARTLGSFARLSAGGRHYIHTLDKTTSESVAEDILDSVRRGLIVTADLSGFHSGGEDMTLLLQLTVAGMGSTGDGYSIPTAGLSAPEEESQPELSQEEPEPEPGQDEWIEPATGHIDPEEPAPNYLIWIISGAAAVILIAGIIIAVSRRKKPAAQPPPIPTGQPAPGLTQAPPVTQPKPAATITPRPPAGKPRIALRMTKIGLAEEQVFRAEFVGQLIIGRDASKSSLPFKDDELLSSRHCSISYEPEGVVLCDLGSTNGTFVNGVPIQDRHILENDDILLIGSMELRINWETL